MKKTKYQIVVDMVRQGYPRKAIAEHLGVNLHSVHNSIKYARSLGINVEFEQLGFVPPRIRKWLKSQTPDGSTMQEMVVAILNDAYNEEMQNEGQ